MHKRQTGLLLVYIYTHTYIYICSLPLFLSLSLLFLLCRGKTSHRLAIWNVSSTKKWGAFGPKSPFRLIKGWRCHKTLRKKHGQMQQIQQPTSVCSDGEDIFNHGLGCGVRPTPGLNPVEHVNPYIKKCNFRGENIAYFAPMHQGWPKVISRYVFSAKCRGPLEHPHCLGPTSSYILHPHNKKRINTMSMPRE